jgi:general stress protein YciG
MCPMPKKKNPAAVALGKLRKKRLSPERLKEIASLGGTARASALSAEEIARIAREAGKVGGRARAEQLSARRRQEIARQAAAARWAKLAQP